MNPTTCACACSGGWQGERCSSCYVSPSQCVNSQVYNSSRCQCTCPLSSCPAGQVCYSLCEFAQLMHFQALVNCACVGTSGATGSTTAFSTENATTGIDITTTTGGTQPEESSNSGESGYVCGVCLCPKIRPWQRQHRGGCGWCDCRSSSAGCSGGCSVYLHKEVQVRLCWLRRCVCALTKRIAGASLLGQTRQNPTCPFKERWSPTLCILKR